MFRVSFSNFPPSRRVRSALPLKLTQKCFVTEELIRIVNRFESSSDFEASFSRSLPQRQLIRERKLLPPSSAIFIDTHTVISYNNLMHMNMSQIWIKYSAMEVFLHPSVSARAAGEIEFRAKPKVEEFKFRKCFCLLPVKCLSPPHSRPLLGERMIFLPFALLIKKPLKKNNFSFTRLVFK